MAGRVAMRTCSGCGSVWTASGARWCGRCGAPLSDPPPDPARSAGEPANSSSEQAPTSAGDDLPTSGGVPGPAAPPPEVEGRQGLRGRGWTVGVLVAVVGVAVVVGQTMMPEADSSPEEVPGTEADEGGDGEVEVAISPDEEPTPEREPPDEPEPAAARQCAQRASEAVDDPPDGWEHLTSPPMREAAELLWAGDQLLQVGGSIAEQHPDADGELFAYIPSGPDAGDVWDCLGDGPFRLEEVAAVATEGGAVFVVSRGRAAMFLPRLEQWRELPAAPFSHTPFTLAWTGEELIAWGNRSGTTRSGAIYDPDTEQWRTMADAPMLAERGDAIWTGEQLVVVARGGAAAYDPHDDAWTELPPSGLSPQAVAATATDSVVVAYDYMLDAGYYDLSAGTWNELPSLPLAAGECFPDANTLTDGTVVAFYCGQLARLDPSKSSWEAIEVPGDGNGNLLAGARPVVAPDGFHLLSSGTFGGTAQHWHYQP